MPDRMRAHSFLRQRRDLYGDFCRVAFHHRVNAESGEWLSATVEEDVFRFVAATDQRKKLVDGTSPERAAARLISLATDLHRSHIAFGHLGQDEVTDTDLSSFVGTGASVVQEEEDRVISTALVGHRVWCREESIYFRLLQVRDQRFHGLL